jgi:hypothetical protein
VIPKAIWTSYNTQKWIWSSSTLAEVWLLSLLPAKQSAVTSYKILLPFQTIFELTDERKKLKKSVHDCHYYFSLCHCHILILIFSIVYFFIASIQNFLEALDHLSVHKFYHKFGQLRVGFSCLDEEPQLIDIFLNSLRFIGFAFLVHFGQILVQKLNVFIVGKHFSEVSGYVFGFVGRKEEECLFLGQDLFYKDCWELILHQDFIFL